MLSGYHAAWASAPYPPVFVTVDGLLLCHGHVLLIQRGHAPGQGLWALPGGFVEPRDTLWQSLPARAGRRNRPAAEHRHLASSPARRGSVSTTPTAACAGAPSPTSLCSMYPAPSCPRARRRRRRYPRAGYHWGICPVWKPRCLKTTSTCCAAASHALARAGLPVVCRKARPQHPARAAKHAANAEG